MSRGVIDYKALRSVMGAGPVGPNREEKMNIIRNILVGTTALCAATAAPWMVAFIARR